MKHTINYLRAKAWDSIRLWMRKGHVDSLRFKTYCWICRRQMRGKPMLKIARYE